MEGFYSIQAEQEILGALLQDNEIIPDIAENLQPGDFSQIKHQLLYTKVLAMYTQSKEVTPITLYEAVGSADIQLSDVLALTNTTPSVKAYKTYIGIIKDYKKKRDITALCKTTLDDLKTQSSVKTTEIMTEKLYEITAEKTSGAMINSESLMSKTLDFIDMAYQTKGEGVGIRTEWESFDKATNGLSKGDLILIGARPSMGKTAFALALMQKIADKGHKTVIFEQEMTEEQLGLRMIASNTKTSVQKVYKGMVSTEEMQLLMKESDRISREKRIFVDCTPAITLLELRNKIRKLKQQQDIEVIIVDHLGLMTPSDANKNTTTQITEISKGLKAIAKEYNVVMIALSQLSRGVEQRNDKRPKMSDLRDSGSLEQDSDLILLLYRDGYYSSETTKYGEYEELEVNIAKARNGKCGTLMMDFDLSTQEIRENPMFMQQKDKR